MSLNNYFIWNLPLFASRALIQERLCLRFGKCSIYIFDPKLPKHRTHAGIARVVCSDAADFGEKTPIDLGFRYPAFAKNSSTRFQPDFKLRSWPSHNHAPDLNSDEKSEDSTFSISMCTSIDIIRPVVVMNEIVNIDPVLKPVTLTCELCNVFDIHSDLIAPTVDFDLPTLSISPETLTSHFELCFDLATTGIASTYSEPSSYDTFVKSELFCEHIESQHSELDTKLHDFEQIKSFIKNLQVDIRPHNLPPDGYIPAVLVNERIRNTFRKCKGYI